MTCTVLKLSDAAGCLHQVSWHYTVKVNYYVFLNLYKLYEGYCIFSFLIGSTDTGYQLIPGFRQIWSMNALATK